MNSTRASDIVRDFIQPLQALSKGQSSQEIIQNFKRDANIEDMAVYNNIRLRAKMMSLVTNMEQAERFNALQAKVNNTFAASYHRLMDNSQ